MTLTEHTSTHYEFKIARLEKENAAIKLRLTEVMDINRKLRAVLDEVIADCDSILKEIK